MFKLNKVLGAVLICGAFAACAVDAQEDGDGAEVTPLAQSSGNRTVHPKFGGPGGTSDRIAGKIKSVDMRTGRVVDNLFISVVDGSPRRFGGEGGSPVGVQRCKPGYEVVGIHGAADKYVDRFGLVCGKLDDPDAEYNEPALGGNGGTEFYDRCDADDEEVAGLNVYHGRVIDAVQLVCRKRS